MQLGAFCYSSLSASCFTTIHDWIDVSDTEFADSVAHDVCTSLPIPLSNVPFRADIAVRVSVASAQRRAAHTCFSARHMAL